MKWIKILSFPLCLLFLIASFSFRIIQDKWNALSLSFLGVSLFFLIFSIILDWKEIVAFFRKRAIKYGLTSFLGILLMLAILSLLNFMSFKHYKRFDLTISKRFSLSDQTIKLLKNLPRPVHLITFFRPDQVVEKQKFDDLMHEFNAYTNKIKIDSYDPDLSPHMAQKYNVNIYGTIVVESSKQQEKINKIDEGELINAILKVIKDTKKVVYFLEGHQEIDLDDTSNKGISNFKDRLIKENYEVKKLSLLSKPEIPSDASLIVIAGPLVDLLNYEIDALNKYLSQGGRVLIFYDPSSSPSLLKILTKWGVKADDNIVVDTVQGFFGGNAFVPQIRSVYGSVVSTSFSLNCFLPYVRTIEKADNADSNKLTVSKIAESTENSWAEYSKEVAQFNEGVDKKGPVSVGVSVNKKLEASTKETRLIVFGDVDFIRNGWFNMLGNGNLALNSVAWLAEETQLISMKEKPSEAAELTLTEYQLRKFMRFSQYIFPAVIIFIGVIIWIRRRKL